MDNTSQQQGGKEDYVDKGLDSVEKKFGGSMGQNSEKNRGVNEKIVSLLSSPTKWEDRGDVCLTIIAD
jgi:hypothetical protein